MNETFPYGTTDWGSILTKIRAEQPAAIVCSVLSVADISSFVKQFMENPTPSLLDISYMVVFKETQEAVGNDLTGVMGYVTSYVTPSAEHDAWKANFKKMFNMDVPLDHPAVHLRLGDALGGSGEGRGRPDQVRGDRGLHQGQPVQGPARHLRLQQRRNRPSSRDRSSRSPTRSTRATASWPSSAPTRSRSRRTSLRRGPPSSLTGRSDTFSPVKNGARGASRAARPHVPNRPTGTERDASWLC